MLGHNIDDLNTSSVSTHQNKRQRNSPHQKTFESPDVEDHTGNASKEDLASNYEDEKVTVLDYAKSLLKHCGFEKEIKSISQCSSSFFVLLYQRLFNCVIKGIDRAPDTIEKKRNNVTLVLNELRDRSYDLTGISAEEVVQLNEDHISRLVMVFVQVVRDMQHMQLMGGQTAPPPGYIVAEVPQYFNPHTNEYYPLVFHHNDMEQEKESSGYAVEGNGDFYDDKAISPISTHNLVEDWRGKILPGDDPENQMHSGKDSPAGSYIAKSSSLVSSSLSLKRAPIPAFKEPPMAPAERRLLAQHPVRMIDKEARDRKIERLRAARFLGEMQDEIRLKMRQSYDERMEELRRSMDVSMRNAARERYETKSRLREENEKYKRAYAAVMRSAANDKRIPQNIMSTHTAHLAEYYAASLRENRQMRMYLEAEQERKNRQEILNYAHLIGSWQRKFAQ